MCLVTYDRNPRVSEHAIYCWKILCRGSDGTLFSPYMKMRYELFRTYYGEGDADVIPSIYNDYSALRPVWYVGKGYIHAYKRLSLAILHLQDVDDAVLCKCIIPHDTPHFLSEEDGEICARRMILLHTVDHDYLKHDTDCFGNKVKSTFGYTVWLSLHNLKRKIRKRLKLKN